MHLRCYTCWWISNQFEQKWPQYKHERSQFTAKFDLTSGLFDLTSKQFYYVKIQSIPFQVHFDLTRGMSLQAWSLHVCFGCLESLALPARDIFFFKAVTFRNDELQMIQSCALASFYMVKKLSFLSSGVTCFTSKRHISLLSCYL